MLSKTNTVFSFRLCRRTITFVAMTDTSLSILAQYKNLAEFETHKHYNLPENKCISSHPINSYQSAYYGHKSHSASSVRRKTYLRFSNRCIRLEGSIKSFYRHCWSKSWWFVRVFWFGINGKYVVVIRTGVL